MEKNFQTTDGRCKQNTHSNSMCRCAQCVTSHTEQNGHISSREHAWLKIAHLCVPKIVVIHVSCLCPCRTWHWPQGQVLSHVPHLSFRRSLPHTRVLWRTIHIYPAKIHGRVADQHKSHLSQVMSPKWSSAKTFSLEELSLTGILGQIRIKHNHGRKLPKFYRRRYEWIWISWCWDVLHPVTDAFRLWLSGKHCRLGSWRWKITKNAGFIAVFSGARGSWIFSKTHSVGKPEAVMIQKRGASPSQEQRAYGKLDAMFSSTNSGVTNWGNQFENSIFNSLIHQIGEDLFLKATRITCSVRQDLKLRSKNIKSDLSILVSVSFSNKLMLKEKNFRTHNTDILNLDEYKFVHKKNYLWRK